ncbi:MAG TPA: class I adenylate-forming enzyme family protein [Kofleriaceae bacterium]|nr:class I adenylate-forming enzyme family protein [Kofleriaceae bacterium]
MTAPDPGASSIGDALAASIEAHGDRLAIIEADRERENGRWTYAELGAEAERFAALLQGHGLTAGDRCAILMANQFKWIASAVGGLWAGAVLVPMDARQPPREQLSLLAHARPRALVIDHPLWRELAAVAAGALDGVTIVVSEAPDREQLGSAVRWDAAPAVGLSRPPRGRDDIATVVYSSGTAGTPKGCMLHHRTYLRQAQMVGAVFRIGGEDRYMSVLPTSHTTDFTVGFLLPLLFGASIVYQRTMRPQFLSAAMRKYEVTFTVLVPLVLRQIEKRLRARLDGVPDWPALLAEHRAGPARPGELPAWLDPIVEAELGARLRLILIGGAFVERGLAGFFFDLGLPVAVGYGLTEAGTVVSISDPRSGPFDGACRVLPGVEVEVREPSDDGVGEVWIRSPTLMAGYLHDEALTGAALVGGWLRTGDLGMLEPDGRLRVVGRIKNMIVTAGGKNVYPEDIESHFDGVPDCAELCVFAENYLWPSSTLVGEGLVVIVRPARGGEVSPGCVGELRRRNRELAGYKRLRGYLAWSRPFPATSSGKTRRDALADELRALDRGAVRPLES